MFAFAVEGFLVGVGHTGQLTMGQKIEMSLDHFVRLNFRICWNVEQLAFKPFWFGGLLCKFCIIFCVRRSDGDGSRKYDKTV